MNAAASASLWWQHLAIALVVGASALSVVRKYLPSLWGRGLALLADALEYRRWPAPVRRSGGWLRGRIPAAVGSGCASSGGCSSCGACASTPAPVAKSAEVPLIVLAPPQRARRAE